MIQQLSVNSPNDQINQAKQAQEAGLVKYVRDLKINVEEANQIIN